jgi:hypothetical protein
MLVVKILTCHKPSICGRKTDPRSRGVEVRLPEEREVSKVDAGPERLHDLAET